MENKNEYKTLEIVNSYSTEFYLLSPKERRTEDNRHLERLDFEKLYDIQTTKGNDESKEYFGKKIYGITQRNQYDDDTTTTAFFGVGDLECRLKSGFLMRVNEKATSEEISKNLIKEKQTKLKDLYQEKEELNKKISKLKN